MYPGRAWRKIEYLRAVSWREEKKVREKKNGTCGVGYSKKIDCGKPGWWNDYKFLI